MYSAVILSLMSPKQLQVLEPFPFLLSYKCSKTWKPFGIIWKPPHPPPPIIAAKLLQKRLLLGLLEPSNTHTPLYISKDGVQLLSLSAHCFFFQHERERKLVLSWKLRLLTDVNRVQLVLSFKWCPTHAAILSEMVVTVVFTRSTTCFLPFNLHPTARHLNLQKATISVVLSSFPLR